MHSNTTFSVQGGYDIDMNGIGTLKGMRVDVEEIADQTMYEMCGHIAKSVLRANNVNTVVVRLQYYNIDSVKDSLHFKRTCTGTEIKP
jgi:hypothetical protein